MGCFFLGDGSSAARRFFGFSALALLACEGTQRHFDPDFKREVRSNSAPDGDGGTVAAWGTGETVTDIGLAGSTLALASNTRLATAPKSGGSLTTRDAGNTYRLTTTGAAIYYFRASPNGGSTCSDGSDLMRLPINGNTVTLIAREPGPCVREMSAENTAVYWIAGDGSSVRKVGG